MDDRKRAKELCCDVHRKCMCRKWVVIDRKREGE